MTPQEAQKLLDAATPGPWGVDSGVAGAAVYSKVGVVCDGTGVDDAPLIAAAPDLAETVAGLRYEYAVQVKRGYWRYDSLLGGWTTRPEYAKWLLDLDEVEGAAEFWGKRYKTRVMRRLVTDPEVAE